MTTWPEATKTDALDQLRAGTTLADVHRATGVPKQTLSGWAKSACIDLGRMSEKLARVAECRWAERRVKLVDDLGALATESVAKARELIADGLPRDAKDAAICGAVGIDKAQLLSGDATVRTEHQAPKRTPEQETEAAKVLRLVTDAA